MVPSASLVASGFSPKLNVGTTASQAQSTGWESPTLSSPTVLTACGPHFRPAFAFHLPRSFTKTFHFLCVPI